jgi:site-specific DNA-methyltransferase (adenine-specific)
VRGIGFIMRGEIIWYKGHIKKRTAWGSFCSPSNPNILLPYEYILVFSKESMKLEFNGKSDITKSEFIKWIAGLWNIKPEMMEREHPAAFPVELPYRLIKLYSYQGCTVLDPFAGTGSVAKACFELNRNSISIELSEKYVSRMKEKLGYGQKKLIGNCKYDFVKQEVSFKKTLEET